MSAGYIQLTALGQQDVYLTGEPQLTYFSGVYRRHTPFVLEAYEIPFLGQNVKYGSKSICRIPPKGDLVRGVTLTVTLPQLAKTFLTPYWYWPNPPTTSNVAQIRINSVSAASNLAPSTGLTWYSTYNATAAGTDQWLLSTSGGNGALINWVRYEPGINSFVFGNTTSGTLTSVWVRQPATSPQNTNLGIFWGLDPLTANFVQTYNDETWYGYTVTNNSLTAQLNLEQSGWLPNPTAGLPPAASRTGLYLQVSTPFPCTSASTFINFNNFINWDSTPNLSVTQQGRIKIPTGLYVMKIGFGLDYGSMTSVSWGQAPGDGSLVSPLFSGTYNWRVSPNPSSPAVFPVNMASTSNSIYIYATGSGSQISTGSYVTVNQADDYFLLTSNIAGTGVATRKVPFYGNVAVTGSATTAKATDGSFTWTMSTVGTYLVNSVVSMSNGYVTAATLLEGTNTVYNYDMSVQGRDPTFTFTMPLVVTDSARNYYINLTCSNTTANIQSGSFFIFNQVGIPSTSSTTQGVLPWSGLTFQTNSTTFTQPLAINSTNFVSNGYNFIESFDSSSTNLVFSSIGTYVLTGAIHTADQLTSVSINTWSITGNTVTTYPVNLGIRPPYSINIPFRISNASSSNTTIIATVNGATAAPNIFANTFFSVYPFAQNTTPVINFAYYDSVGTLAISSAELKIGGQSIQTLTGEAIELWNDLNVPYENQQALKVLTGKGDTGSNVTASRTYYVNLPFYFFGSPELSIPVCALGRQDIEVHVTFNNFSKLTGVTSATNPNLANPSLFSTIIVEYVYLSDPEINWFKNNRIEQVILQTQYQTINLDPGFASGVFKLGFNNPVRELFFVFQNIKNLPQDPYNYTLSGLQSIGLSFNGYEAFTTTTADATYLGTIEPLNHYVNFPTRQFYMYCFCTQPGSVNPSGFVNFSRIRDVLLSINLTSSSLSRVCRITGVSYNVLRIENGLAGLAFNSA
jgi:hypothetical protein